MIVNRRGAQRREVRSPGLVVALCRTVTCLLLVVAGLAHTSCLGSQAKLRVQQPVRGQLAAGPFLRHPHPTTVVVVLDGVRWQEVFEGVEAERARRLGLPVADAPTLMPNLHRLIERHGCALGSQQSDSALSASGPNFVSLPGYTEIFTGQAPLACASNEDCAPVTKRTIADQAAALQDRVESVAVITSWPDIARVAATAPQRMVVSAGRSGGSNRHLLDAEPATRSVFQRAAEVSPEPGYGDFRPDRYTAALALRYWDHFKPQFLFLGLGDTDEHAHQGNYAAYLQALQAADTAIGELYERLAHLEARGARTLLVVTSDHGRGDNFTEHGQEYPESARTWLVAAGNTVKWRGLVVSPEPRRLADLAPTLRAVWGISPNQGLNASAAGQVLTELF